jgi:non-canonical (house-cleaning) NTP pyrophosphatase
VLFLLGSTRPAKIDGVRQAVEAIAAVDARFANPRFHTFDLRAIAPRMPLSEADIIDGARRRAMALEQMDLFVQGEAMAVGLEGGLSPIEIDGRPLWMLQTWAAITDGVVWGYGAGGAIVVPKALAERVAAGEELGDVIDGLAGEPTRGTRGAWGVLTRDLTGRRDAFRLAALAALAPFYNSRLYTPV